MLRLKQFVNWSKPSPMTLLRTRSMGTETEYNVSHDSGSSKFFIQLAPDAEAKLEYVIEKGKIMDMYHTEVPPSHQGKGIAAVLAQVAFDYAVDNQMKMRLTCSYLQKFYREHPKEEYRKLIL